MCGNSEQDSLIHCTGRKVFLNSCSLLWSAWTMREFPVLRETDGEQIFIGSTLKECTRGPENTEE